MAEPLQVIQSSDGRQFVRLENGNYLEIMPKQMIPDKVPINLTKTDTSTEFDNDQPVTLEDINERLIRIETYLQKVMLFMADVSKFMELRAEPATTTAPVKRRRENFEEFDMLFPIINDEMLLSFETRLNDQVFFEKLLRYVSCQYELNGKRDGKAFFKTLIRKMITPYALLPYSWLGKSRHISQDREPNKSFKNLFKNIVKFFNSATSEADCTFSNEGVCKAFSVILRQKHTEMKRFLAGGERRTPSSRVRPRKVELQSMKMEMDMNMESSEMDTTSMSSASEDNEDSLNTL